MILHEFGRALRVSEFANSGSHKLLRQGLVLEPTDAGLVPGFRSIAGDHIS